MFDLEREIDQWLKKLRKNPGFEDGDIAEVEEHIRDSVESGLDNGISEEQAFSKAKALFGSMDLASDEMLKSRTDKMELPKPKKYLELSYTNSNNRLIQSTVMFNNYLKIAFRSLNKSKTFAVINILGLALGMTCFMLIGLYVKYELSVNDFHSQKDRIFRISIEDPSWNFRGSTKFAQINAPLAPVLMKEYSDVEYATRFTWAGATIHYENNENEIEASGLYGDNYFFKIFDFKFLKGSPKNALSEPFSLVITETLAEKLFGQENPINKVIAYNKEHKAKITGVIDIPENSQIKFEYLISMPSWKTLVSNWNNDLTEWDDNNWVNFVLLNKGVSYPDFEKKLAPLITAHYQYESEALKPRYFLEPFSKLYLQSSGVNFHYFPSGNLKYIYLFSTVALLILLIACMNYINCATARATKRKKEIGIRKTIGAHKIQLVKQFLGESYLVTFLSAAIALGLTLLVLPSFNAFVGKSLDQNLFSGLNNYVFFLSLVIAVGTISGLYPALLLSTYNPIKALKRKKMASSRINARSLLVLFQFSITITLIIFSIAIQQQLHYVKTKDIGFNRENIAITYLDTELLHSKFDVIKNDLLNYPNVINISKSVFSANSIFAPGPIRIEGEDEIVTIPSMNRNHVDHEFIALNSIEIIKGRDFSVELPSDLKNAVIINETAARIAGMKNPIGKEFASRGREFDRTVIGVVKDFHFTSLKMSILPLALILDPDHGDRVSIKIKGVNTSETLKFIESVFMAQDKDHIFEYEFLDDTFNARYRSDQKMGSLLTTFSMVTIFIAVLGLVGLITYTVEQATKEIGIRKALGATVSNIVTLLSKNFLVLLALSNVIAWPVGYYVVTRWLQEFAYKMDLGISVFLLAGISVFVIALVTTSFQTIKSARANPVESLRYE